MPRKPEKVHPDLSAMYDDGGHMLAPILSANENVFIDEKSTREDELEPTTHNVNVA